MRVTKRRNGHALLAVAGMVGGVALYQPAFAASRAATATATTIKSLSITKTRDLDFGTFLPGSGGTVTLDPVTAARTTVGVVALGTTASTARFTGAGTPGRMIGVSYPATALTLNRTGGGAAMTLEALTTNSGQYARPGSDLRIIPPTGIIEVLIGGRLRVGANQADGTYSATFAVTIDYY